MRSVEIEAISDIVSNVLRSDVSVDDIPTSDKDQYLENILEAFRVYIARDSIRRGLWKQYPARDQMQQIKIKAERVLSILERYKRDLDEAAALGAPSEVIGGGIAREDSERAVMLEELDDIINYAVFAKRIIKEGDVIHHV